MEEEKFNYDSIPVEFCKNAACCSLAIIEEDGIVYCRDCGCPKTERAPIDIWKDYYFIAHGKNLIDE